MRISGLPMTLETRWRSSCRWGVALVEEASLDGVASGEWKIVWTLSLPFWPKAGCQSPTW
jgi:hypothetical protein